MALPEQYQLTVEESLALAKEHAYWDGFAAGAQVAAAHAKYLSIQQIVDSRKPSPPPVQPAPEV